MTHLKLEWMAEAHGTGLVSKEETIALADPEGALRVLLRGRFVHVHPRVALTRDGGHWFDEVRDPEHDQPIRVSVVVS